MLKPESLTPGQVSDIRRTFGRQESASGVLFQFQSNGFLTLQPPIWDSGQPPDNILGWYVQRYGPIEVDTRLYPMSGSTLGKAEQIKTKKGGTGIWARTIEEAEVKLPTITLELDQIQDQVLFLGNGLSDVPLRPGGRYKRGELTHPPVMVDMFNYQALMQDFTRLNDALCRLSMIPSSLGNFLEYHTKLSSLFSACNDGSLQAVEYFVGGGKPPPILMNSGLIVNCCGPSLKTLPEQLSCLAVGGRLLITQDIASVPPEFRLESLRSGATKITRIV